jgi:hypothetical protein
LHTHSEGERIKTLSEFGPWAERATNKKHLIEAIGIIKKAIGNDPQSQPGLLVTQRRMESALANLESKEPFNENLFDESA